MSDAKPPEAPPSPEQALAELKSRKLDSNRAVLMALFRMIHQNRNWWLMPILMVLAFLSLFVSLTGNSSILPAIYALF
jgi:hypothetical protein